VKKKVIVLVVDTDLTNAQIEKSHVVLQFSEFDNDPARGEAAHEARNVRVVDSD